NEPWPPLKQPPLQDCATVVKNVSSGQQQQKKRHQHQHHRLMHNAPPTPPSLSMPPTTADQQQQRCSGHRELEEARAKSAQLEKTMRWWSDCTASWRDKWSRTRNERNLAREEARQQRRLAEEARLEADELRRDRDGLLLLLQQQQQQRGADCETAQSQQQAQPPLLLRVSASTPARPTVAAHFSQVDKTDDTERIDPAEQSVRLAKLEELERSLSVEQAESGRLARTVERLHAALSKKRHQLRAIRQQSQQPQSACRNQGPDDDNNASDVELAEAEVAEVAAELTRARREIERLLAANFPVSEAETRRLRRALAEVDNNNNEEGEGEGDAAEPRFASIAELRHSRRVCSLLRDEVASLRLRVAHLQSMLVRAEEAGLAAVGCCLDDDGFSRLCAEDANANRLNGGALLGPIATEANTKSQFISPVDDAEPSFAQCVGKSSFHRVNHKLADNVNDQTCTGKVDEEKGIDNVDGRKSPTMSTEEKGTDNVDGGKDIDNVDGGKDTDNVDGGKDIENVDEEKTPTMSTEEKHRQCRRRKRHDNVDGGKGTDNVDGGKDIENVDGRKDIDNVDGGKGTDSVAD
uniref:Coiled-coil domain-containing protein 102A n=1 Tax=Macrostomum lignano TaxID=282301 RepID=A0A1I8JLD2_9PLAT